MTTRDVLGEDNDWTHWQSSWNRSIPQLEEAPGIIELLEHQALIRPAAIACMDDEQQLSFNDFLRLVHSYAAGLDAVGMQIGDRIGICLPPSCAALAVIYAVIAKGGAIVPLDPRYPVDRLRHSIRAATPNLVIGVSSTRSLVDLPSPIWMDLRNLYCETTIFHPWPSISPDTPIFLAFTSGSTGTPKGIALSHSLVLNRLRWMWDDFPFLTEDCGCWRTSMNFVDALWEWFGYLPAGRCCYILPGDHLSDPERMLQKLARHNVSHIWLVPSVLEMLLDEFPDIARRVPRLLTWGPGGELLSQRLAQRFFERIPDGRLINLYGLSETWDVLYHHIRPGEQVTLGRPLPNTYALVVDNAMQAVAPDVEGELLVSVPHMAHGYLAAGPADQARFVSISIDGRPLLFYRTGDRAHITTMGRFVSHGRADRQLNRAGYRIEAEEIESLAYAIPGVKHAALASHENGDGLKLLLAVVRAPSAILTSDEIEATLAKQLPAAAMPDDIVFINQLPNTPSGKIDRLALIGEHSTQRPLVQVKTGSATLAWLLDEVCSLSASASCQPSDTLFRTGIHSLAAMRLLIRINRRFESRLTLRDIYQCASIDEIARRIDHRRSADNQRITDRPTAECLASPIQEALWSHAALHPRDTRYHIVERWPVPPGIAAGEALSALCEELQSHAMLGAKFASSEGKIVVSPNRANPETQSFHLPAETQPAMRFARALFDLTHGPLWRAAVLFDLEGPAILFVVHHIVCDAYSLLHLRRRWERRLGREPVEAAPTLTECIDVHRSAYALDIEDQRRYAQYWEQRLADHGPRFQIEGDNPALEVPLDGSAFALASSAPLAESIRSAASRLGYSTAAVLLAACAVVLWKVARRRQITIAMPVTMRSHPKSESVMGLCTDSIPIVLDPPSAGQGSVLLAQAQQALAEAIAHQGLPYPDIARFSQEQPVSAEFPLTGVYLNYLGDWGATSPVEPGVHRPLWTDQNFDIDLYLWEERDRLIADWHYRSARFLPQTIECMAEALFRATEQLLADPSFDICRWRLDAGSPPPTNVRSDACSLSTESVASQAFRLLNEEPAADCVVDLRGVHTRGEIRSRVRALLASLGKADLTNAPVGVLCSASSDVIVAVLAAALSGRAYVPLDPNYPEQWLKAAIQELRPCAILCAPETIELARAVAPGIFAGIVPQSPSAEDPDGPIVVPSISHLYTLFTSGSTGQPKAISQTDAHFKRHIRRFIALLGMNRNDRLAMAASHATEAGNKDLWSALLSGGVLVQIDLRHGTALHALPAFLRAQNITIWHSIPRIYRELLSHAGIHNPWLRCVVLGGDQCNGELIRQHRESTLASARLIAFYGMTESSTIAAADLSHHPVAFRVPLGNRWAEDRLIIEGNDGQPADFFEIGEIVFQSPWLTTAGTRCEAFGDPVLRTGDLGYRHPSGDIFWVGRAAWRTKINGVLINTFGVERCLESHPAVREAALATVDGGSPEPLLIGWIVPWDGRAPLPDLRVWLAARLPAAAVPSKIALVDQLPRTPGGKIDRLALASEGSAALFGREAATTEIADPTLSPWAEILISLWKEILGCDEYLPHLPFWEQGGNSLCVIQLVSRLAANHGTEISLDIPYRHPTIFELAGYLETLPPSATSVQPAIPHLPIPRTLQISPLQSYYWTLSQLPGGSAAYNLPVALRIRKTLDAQKTEHILNRLLERHLPLRIRFRLAHPLPEQIVEPACRLELQRWDFTGKTADELHCHLGQLARTPIALDCPPLMRAALIEESADVQILFLAFHHIIADGWSIDLFLRDFCALYNTDVLHCGQSPAPAPLQFHEALSWQDAQRQGSSHGAQREYWIKRLRGLRAYSVLPAATGASPQGRSFAGQTEFFRIDPELSLHCRRFVEQRGFSLYELLLAPLYILFAGYTGKLDQAFGTPVANRPHPNLEQVFGLFINVIVIRHLVNPSETAEDLVRKIHAASLEGLKHAGVPLDEIVQALAVPRSGAENPFYQVVFRYHNQTSSPWRIGKAELEWFPVDTGTAKVDLNLSMYEGKEGLIEASLEYDCDRYDQHAVRDLVSDYRRVLSAIVKHPEKAVMGILESFHPGAAIPPIARGKDPNQVRILRSQLRDRRLSSRKKEPP